MMNLLHLLNGTNPVSMNPWVIIMVFHSAKKVESAIDHGSDNSTNSDCIENGIEGSVITAAVMTKKVI